MQNLLHDDVPGNETAAEEHGEVEEERDDVSRFKILSGKNVARHGDAEKGNCRAADGLDDGVFVSADDVVRIGEQHVVSGGGPLFREEGIAFTDDFAVVGKGTDDHQNEGQKARKREKTKKDFRNWYCNWIFCNKNV